MRGWNCLTRWIIHQSAVPTMIAIDVDIQMAEPDLTSHGRASMFPISPNTIIVFHHEGEHKGKRSFEPSDILLPVIHPACHHQQEKPQRVAEHGGHFA